MFAKSCAKILYPEIAYCAWLGVLPGLLFCYIASAIFSILFGNIDFYETLSFYATFHIPAGIYGVLLGGILSKLMQNKSYLWIVLSFLIPLQVTTTYALISARWNVVELLSYGDWLWFPLGLSLTVSTASIILRLIINATIPKTRALPG